MAKYKPSKSTKRDQSVQYLVPEVGKNRALAALVDWIVGGIFSGLPAVTAYALLSGSGEPLKDLYVFEAMGYSTWTTLLIAALCLVFAFFYYVIVPWKLYPGQTLGKRWLHLKIVNLDGTPLSLSDLVVRNFIILFFVEGTAVAASNYLRVILTTITRVYLDSYIGIAWSVLTIISMALLFGTKKHLALHDLLCHTTVIREE
jgi:uncharacterized RDD family membrane protein YckC